ncbi:MAG: cytochrome b [Tatlockia sp.]|jgi:cytochrome b561
MKQQAVVNYSRGSIILHWLIAVIVMIMLSGSYFLDDLPEQYIGTAFLIHKSVGITVFFLMGLRVLWLWMYGKPKLPQTMSMWQKALAHTVQYAMVIGLFLMPLCGWIMSVAANKIPSYFGLFSLPLPWIEPSKALASFMKESHNTIAWILIVLIIVHIIGALKHHYIDKDTIFRRMVSSKRLGRQMI